MKTVHIHVEVWTVQRGKEEIQTAALAISKNVRALVVCFSPVFLCSVCLDVDLKQLEANEVRLYVLCCFKTCLPHIISYSMDTFLLQFHGGLI